MNARFAPLYSYVENMEIFADLISHEQKRNGNLSDLVFLAEYDKDDHPGSGAVSVYRLSQGLGCAPIEPGGDNLLGKLWFIEDSDWLVLRHQPVPGHVLHRFYALFAYHYDYRPVLRVDMNRPLLKIKTHNLPVMYQYPQQRPKAYQPALV